MNLKRTLLGLLGAALAAVLPAQAATNLVSGFLYGTNNWVATNTYVLNGFTYVMSNSVLNIEAGTLVQGVPGTGSGTNAANDFGSLFVCAGGRLNAVGTAQRPIIFTASTDDITDPEDLPFPTRGLWGGIVLLGNARLNNPAWTTNNVSYEIYEGLPDTIVTNTAVGPFNGQRDFIHRFGGSNDDDSSGCIRFVSVRHGGKRLTTDREINGVSLGAVGRGTVFEYVEAYCIADDGFEWFGGSVNSRFLVSAFNDDDGFDTDEGFNGKNQFWFGIQEPAAKDNGSEQNGQPNAPDILVPGALPLSTYQVRNATLIGAGTNTTGNDALRIRRDNDCSWINSVITDFGGVRVRIDDDGVSTPIVTNNIFFGFRAGANEDYGGIYAPAASNPVLDPQIVGISRTPAGLLDPRVRSTSPVFTDVADAPVDGFWTQTGYKGAFDANDNWAYGWTGLSAEGFFPPRTNEVSVASGYLYGTNNWVATNIYIMQGFVYVMSNAVLNIEAGTVIKGVPGSGAGTNAANDFGSLFVCTGGRLNATGSRVNPVVFTASTDDTTDPTDLPFPTRGLWGGIVLMGNARLNNPAWTTNNVSYDIYEGLPDTIITNTAVGPFNGQRDFIHRFGGSNDNDSSGVLRYVSIRHGGKRLTTDREINGLSLGAVGRGTTLECVEAYCIADDGFEWFGGSVNSKYLVSAFNDDDGFDTDEGFNGKNQFWFGIQEPAAKDNGSEQNGQPNAPDILVSGALPQSTYEVWNATLIGAGTNTTGNDALRIRRDNDCSWFNSVITDFGGVRVRIDDDGVSTPTVANNIFFNFRAGANEDYGGVYAPAALNPVADPLLRRISRSPDGTLDPTVATTSPVFAGFRPTAGDGFLTPVAYVGAFNQENWAQDWTALEAERFFRATCDPAAEKFLPEIPLTVDCPPTGTQATVTWGTSTGRQYKVQSTTDMAVWADETAWANGTGSSVSQNFNVPGVRKLFRVLAR
jgi:trimeric autotransporter adhesin